MAQTLQEPTVRTSAPLATMDDGRCPECNGSGIDSVMAGERCMLCKGHG